MLGRLPDLFSRLPDDRYRIYEIREDGVSQLVTDVVVRGGKAVERVSVDSNEEERDEQNWQAEPLGASLGDDMSVSSPVGEPLGAVARHLTGLTKRAVWQSDREFGIPAVIADGPAEEAPEARLPLAYALRSIRSGS
ncbi:MAG: hypothetical protein EA381_08375 [Planctomycetaceae bacterium]|nr:MAG: hypothetical protein EA381_08375 [Planctomycetaceae bacterium]